MAIKFFLGRRFREHNADGDGGGGGERRPSPAEINAARNRERLSRIQSIGDTADGQRADQLVDVDGERVVGRFQDGALDDSPAARERRALQEDELARQALEEQEERAREAERLEQEEARRLQEEGGLDPDERRETSPGRGQRPDGTQGSDPDEKVIDGVRYYRTMVSGSEKWLTAKELRQLAATAGDAESALQRAQDALQRASQTDLSPKPDEVEVPDEKDLENIILSASMGDEEAVRKLASIVRQRPKGLDPKDVSRQVAQQIATQRLVDASEQDCKDLLGNKVLEPEFRRRLSTLAQSKPNTRIDAAYKEVADGMRKDFAAMITSQRGTGAPPADKAQRKRAIVNPPASAGRQPRREEDDREVPVSEQIDAIARARGQQRAHRIRRS